ncbi:MAG: glycosyl transferase family 2 [Oscillospiraceae bacterium]|nr:glycosyl transferase family 2 [Oscillospiraceae bacterium]
MKDGKESNFLSAAVYLGANAAAVPAFLDMLQGQLAAHFEAYEILCVSDAQPEGAEAAKAWAQAHPGVSLSLINMSLRQGVELSMNAALDLAIGDFILEFDTIETPYPPKLIWQCYQKALEGHDIVTAAPKKNRRVSSRLFYRLFNAFSGSMYPLQTDLFHLLSRRAVNRLKAQTAYMPYRKAAYAASGLKLAVLRFDGPAPAAGADHSLSQALDSLALYTNAAYKFSLGLSLLLLAVTVAAAVYALILYLGAFKPIEGWTTTMLVMCGGFFGVFLILAIVLKYLSLLVELVFRRQSYLVESIEKLG